MKNYRELISSRARMYTLALIKCLKEDFNDAEIFWQYSPEKIKITYQNKSVCLSFENLEMYANDFELGTTVYIGIINFFRKEEL